MKLRKIAALVMTAATVSAMLLMTGCQKKEEGTYKIGICQLVEHSALDAATEGFKKALTEKLGDKVEFDTQLAQGEITNCTTIVNKFVTSKVDLIMANATNAVKAAREATSDIPIVGTSVTDYVTEGIIESDEKPGANVTGASDINPVTVQVGLMKELCPDAKTIGIVYCSGEGNSKIQAEEAKAAFEAEGYSVKIYTVADTNEIQTVVTGACTEVDAFYEPTDNLISSNVALMSSITTPAGKPVICAEKGMCSDDGFLATYSIDYEKLGYEAGMMAYKILEEKADPAEMSVYKFDVDELELVINEKSAETLEITIPDSLKK